MACAITAPREAIRVASHGGTRPACSGRSALPVRLAMLLRGGGMMRFQPPPIKRLWRGARQCFSLRRRPPQCAAQAALWPTNKRKAFLARQIRLGRLRRRLCSTVDVDCGLRRLLCTRRYAHRVARPLETPCMGDVGEGTVELVQTIEYDAAIDIGGREFRVEPDRLIETSHRAVQVAVVVGGDP